MTVSVVSIPYFDSKNYRNSIVIQPAALTHVPTMPEGLAETFRSVATGQRRRYAMHAGEDVSNILPRFRGSATVRGWFLTLRGCCTQCRTPVRRGGHHRRASGEVPFFIRKRSTIATNTLLTAMNEPKRRVRRSVMTAQESVVLIAMPDRSVSPARRVEQRTVRPC